MYKPKHFIVAVALLVGIAVPAGAQQPPPPPTTPYGPPIGLEAAKKAMAAAEAEAVKNKLADGHRYLAQHRPYRDAA